MLGSQDDVDGRFHASIWLDTTKTEEVDLLGMSMDEIGIYVHRYTFDPQYAHADAHTLSPLRSPTRTSPPPTSAL
eukprot:216008-Rhodomonas_salina.2